MFELVVLACLIAEPERCERIVLPPEPRRAAMACLRTAQFRIAEWAEDHPGWRVRRWSCRLPEA